MDAATGAELRHWDNALEGGTSISGASVYPWRGKDPKTAARMYNLVYNATLAPPVTGAEGHRYAYAVRRQ